MTNQEYNIKIAKYILAKCKGKDGEDLRFTQLLFNLGINEFSEITKRDMNTIGSNILEFTLKDKYNEKSEVTYNKLMETILKEQTLL
jgi:hypothetical protein